MARKVRLAEVRSIVRSELLCEWQETPSSFDEFLQQQKVAARGFAPEVERILAAYEETVESADDKQVVVGIVKKMMQAVYAALESDVFAPKSGMRKRAA